MRALAKPPLALLALSTLASDRPTVSTLAAPAIPGSLAHTLHSSRSHRTRQSIRPTKPSARLASPPTHSHPPSPCSPLPPSPLRCPPLRVFPYHIPTARTPLLHLTSHSTDPLSLPSSISFSRRPASWACSALCRLRRVSLYSAPHSQSHQSATLAFNFRSAHKASPSSKFWVTDKAPNRPPIASVCFSQPGQNSQPASQPSFAERFSPPLVVTNRPTSAKKSASSASTLPAILQNSTLLIILATPPVRS